MTTKLHVFLTSLLIIAAAALAEQTATTSDGAKVLLLDNGTWKYVKDDVKKADAVSSLQHTSLIEIVKNDRRYDFRNAKWGMTKKQVMASETAKITKNEPQAIEYTVQFMGYACTVVYTFSGDALIKAAFLIGQNHVDPALFYNDYEELKQYLAPLYGKPATDRCDWVNEMYRDDKSKWGFAVSLGFLSCSTRWNNERTGITLSINGGNHLIATSIEYGAPEKQ